MAEAARATGTGAPDAFDAAIKHFETSIELLPNQWNSYLEVSRRRSTDPELDKLGMLRWHVERILTVVFLCRS